MKINPLYLLAIIGLLLGVFAAIRGCQPKPKPSPHAETVTGLIAAEPEQRTAYAMPNAVRQRLLRLRADSLAYATAKATIQREKARQTYANYQKQPTLANCAQALLESRKEAETCWEINGLLSRQVTDLEADTAAKAVEISRSWGRFDSLGVAAKGLIGENDALRKGTVKLYATVAAEYNPVNANLKAGAVVTFPNGLLMGYQKGILQNTHEITAGLKIRLGKKQ